MHSSDDFFQFLVKARKVAMITSVVGYLGVMAIAVYMIASATLTENFSTIPPILIGWFLSETIIAGASLWFGTRLDSAEKVAKQNSSQR